MCNHRRRLIAPCGTVALLICSAFSCWEMLGYVMDNDPDELIVCLIFNEYMRESVSYIHTICFLRNKSFGVEAS